MSERPTLDTFDSRRRSRAGDSEDLPSRGGVWLPRYFPLAALLTVFSGIAAGTAWAVSVQARVQAVERAVDPDLPSSAVSRQARRLEALELDQRQADSRAERVILVLCSLCKGLPRADCTEACKAGR